VHRLVAGDELADLLEPYTSVLRDPSAGRCWVLANMVGGLDGSAAIGGRVGDLSDDTDQRLFRSLRSLSDVVLVGAETVRREGYGPVRLTDDQQAERLRAGRRATPAIAIVSRSLRLDWESSLFAGTADDARTIVVTCSAAEPARRARAATVADVIVAGEDRVDPAVALCELAARGIRVALCEGGPTLLGELAAADLLDELCLTVAPVLGGDPLPVAVAPESSPLIRLRLAHVLAEADTLYLRYQRDVP
jgi:riboflavin biosynthesis pyrimidine reductase